MSGKCNMDCLNCKLPACKYDKYENESTTAAKKASRQKVKKEPKAEVAKSVKKVILHPSKGRPKKYEEGTYWENYSREHREELNAKERERYKNNREEILEKNRKWREEHREYFIEYNRMRREKYRNDRNSDGKSQVSVG